MSIEFKVTLSGRKQSITITRTDINVLLAGRNESLKDLAKRIPCAWESLSRLLNGHGEFPLLRRKLVIELERMIEELNQAKPGLPLACFTNSDRSPNQQ